MKLPLAALLLLTLGTVARAACPVAEIEQALGQSLAAMKMTEREVSDIQSTEGGAWRIYHGRDGQVHSIVRLDGGESGMGERRLSIVDADAYGIAVTRVDYLRHAFVDDAGPNGTAKRTTEYFYYCGGRLFLPPADFATPDLALYATSGEEAKKAMVLDKDVGEFTRALAR